MVPKGKIALLLGEPLGEGGKKREDKPVDGEAGYGGKQLEERVGMIAGDLLDALSKKDEAGVKQALLDFHACILQEDEEQDAEEETAEEE